MTTGPRVVLVAIIVLWADSALSPDLVMRGRCVGVHDVTRLHYFRRPIRRSKSERHFWMLRNLGNRLAIGPNKP